MVKATRRNYKDTVFVDLFAKCAEAKENFLSLYNALHKTHLRLDETKIELVMLEQTVYTGRYNDVSMLINGKIIVLIEQQSTVNENMPLRFLEYISRLYEKLIPLEERYKIKRIKLPDPEFYVFYNGTDDYPPEKTLFLSDAFDSCSDSGKKENSLLELSVKVYNINKRQSVPFIQQCAALSGYARLTEYAQQAKKSGRDDWLDYAVQKCIREGFIADYLKRNSTEVRNMLIAEYDYDTDIKVKQQEAFEEGIEQGIARQKAEDEKQFAEMSAQKDAEIMKLQAEILQLRSR